MSRDLIVLIIQIAILPAFSFLFRGWLKQFTTRLAMIEKWQHDNEAWQREIENQMDAKVSREDFIRETSRTRQTLEKLIEGQARIEGKMDIGTRIAGTLERIAEREDGRNG